MPRRSTSASAAVACALVAAGAARVSLAQPETVRQLDHAEASFARYVAEHGKVYADAEERALRLSLFSAELARVEAHNARGASYTLGLNSFSDRTAEEKRAYRGYTRSARRRPAAAPKAALAATATAGDGLPEAVDWRQQGVVTPPKNQASCGSCWAHASTECLESAVAITTGKLFNFSVQELVSCVPNPDACGGTGGCEGATAPLAFASVITRGIVEESAYPYTAETSTCDDAVVASPVAGITGYTHVTDNSPQALKEAVATIGPVSISVAASKWFGYSGGIYDDADACGYEVDHLVQLVGYGTDQDSGTDYWIVRNSWGQSWGEQGYIRLKREAADEAPVCGTDDAPDQGSACKGAPETLKVCGICGMYSDSNVPTGAFLFDAVASM
uniref:Cysteine protease n=2 Tax=Prasinoderma singulare TaxID=676789 RepID=A0A7S3BM85_9VIRI|mmetsp:Transcript_19260/g.59886  ORF Transcript_19260/g.59886 Transcript_19260/m.59886 type:complete len:389 (+) Transcript_19260:23-1189(+)